MLYLQQLSENTAKNSSQHSIEMGDHRCIEMKPALTLRISQDKEIIFLPKFPRSENMLGNSYILNGR